MGGIGSGQYGGRPKTDSSLDIDLSWMIRTGRARLGSRLLGNLSWSRNGESVGSIFYLADMMEPNAARLLLIYQQGLGDSCTSVQQEIRLTHTSPNYGGRRWWMICPTIGIRVGKLYFPPGGDRFASRQAWQLRYHSQAIDARSRPFEAMSRLQRKLGGPQLWGVGLADRPKGMWNRSYQRLWDECHRLDDRCTDAARLILGGSHMF